MSATGVSTHPLDPLDGDEVRLAASTLKSDSRYAEIAHPRFISIELEEPAKGEGAAAPARRVRIVLLDRAVGSTIEAIVSITDRVVERWDPVPEAQGAIMVSELGEAAEAVRADPRFVEAVRRRGIDDLNKVQIDAWPPGNFGYPEEQGLRLARAIAFQREHLYDNGYAHPLEGIIALVDLNAMEVLEVQDHEVVPVPPRSGEFDPDSVGALREEALEPGKGVNRRAASAQHSAGSMRVGPRPPARPVRRASPPASRSGPASPTRAGSRGPGPPLACPGPVTPATAVPPGSSHCSGNSENRAAATSWSRSRLARVPIQRTRTPSTSGRTCSAQ